MDQPTGQAPDRNPSPASASGTQVAASKAIQQRTGATFHLATRLLPRRVRRATYVLYAFFRVADDVVDDPDPDPPAAQRATLEHVRKVAHGAVATDDPVLGAFRDVADQYDVSSREIDAFVDAMVRDVDADDYATYAELEQYLRGSSVAVANMMLSVMEPDEPEQARPHARALAEAFQMTNFCRDVREDVEEYDRVYLPASTLADHDKTTDDVRDLEASTEIRAAVRTELRRTEALYRDGVAGIGLLPADCQFAVLLSATLYAEHHRLIRQHDFDVLSHRPSLSTTRRLHVLARTWIAWRRLGDPKAVFYQVSPVDAQASDPVAVQNVSSPDAGCLETVRDHTPRRLRTLGTVVPWVGK